jgi:hypothetical protein
MSMVVTISNETNLRKTKQFLGAKDESEAVELALEKIVKEFEQNQPVRDLPEVFFDDLFAEETNLSNGESVQAVIKEREEESEIDVSALKRIPPKKGFKVTANFKIGGRRKPMKYDFSDFEEENNL